MKKKEEKTKGKTREKGNTDIVVAKYIDMMRAKIKAACGFKNISQKKLAELLDMNASSLNQRIKRGSLSIVDYAKIMEAMNGHMEIYFVFDEHTRI